MTAIEWTDVTWNPVVGCTKVSAGCTHCYAIRVAHRLETAFRQPVYEGLTRTLPDGSRNWTGTVRCLPERLQQPLKWAQPRRVFVNSMSDLFHEGVPDEFLDQVFGTMALATAHTFQVLTKRPERMLSYIQRLGKRLEAEFPYLQAVGRPDGVGHRVVVRWGDGSALANELSWPLTNVWLGVSVEDQAAADERIPLLLETPAAVRFLSCEPLLGPIRLENVLCGCDGADPVVCPRCGGRGLLDTLRMGVSWVIVGGESGPHHRPMDPGWARSLRDQCQERGAAFLFKQWGGPTPKAGGRELDGRTWDEFPATRQEAICER